MHLPTILRNGVPVNVHWEPLDAARAREAAARAAAWHLVGELCREGRPVWYVNDRDTSGRLTGQRTEFPSVDAAIDYVLRDGVRHGMELPVIVQAK